MRISDWSSDVCSSDLLADHGDMADRHGTAGREGKDGADAGFMAALIAALGLAPPAIGVAVKLDAGNLPGEGHALQDAGGGRGRDQGAECKRCRCDNSAKTTDHRNATPDYWNDLTP